FKSPVESVGCPVRQAVRSPSAVATTSTRKSGNVRGLRIAGIRKAAGGVGKIAVARSVCTRPARIAISAGVNSGWSAPVTLEGTRLKLMPVDCFGTGDPKTREIAGNSARAGDPANFRNFDD